ncbi:MAG TPA: hypothetical protein VGM44_18205 [Polyangiaceae bacterium]
MAHTSMRRSITGAFIASFLLALSGCSGGAAGDSQFATDARATAQARASLSTEATSCDDPSAGGGWLDTAVPNSSGSLTLDFLGFPHTNQLDAVVGLSNGAADAFTDLGPIVRFNPNGAIDARNGDHYEGSFPWTTGVGPFELRMDIDIPTHTYTVWVRHLDSPSKPFELLGQNFAFRTEQSQVSELNDVGRFIDSAAGDLDTCDVVYTATSSPDSCITSNAGSWASQTFPPHAGAQHIEFDATPDSGSIDAVVGASLNAPAAFSDLAAIARFNPNGTFDARNGSSYGADATVAYSAGTPYHFALDLDLTAHSYSVSVNAPGQAPTQIAHDYAFRTEQASLTAVGSVGTFVDGGAGSLQVCSVSIRY